MHIRKNIFIHRAFTLPEVLITLALFGIMASISLPYLGDFYRNENTDSHCRNVRQTIYRASTRSMGGEQGSTWGVKLSGNTYTLFAGNTYDTRTTAFDETYTLPGSMQFSGILSFRFEKYSGQPIETGSVYIIFDGNSVLCATVRESGLVE